jgi:hypothetical protein
MTHLDVGIDMIETIGIGTGVMTDMTITMIMTTTIIMIITHPVQTDLIATDIRDTQGAGVLEDMMTNKEKLGMGI